MKNTPVNVTDEQMNALQDAGIISDNCVTWEDVCFDNRLRAVRWLAEKRGLKQASMEFA